MISETKGPDTKRRVGGRSARVVHDVLEATMEELGRVGYAALTIEGVAATAQVNRTTVYRRWPTKFALVNAAMLAHAESSPPTPDTGSLRSDLLALARERLTTMALPHARAIAAAIINEPPDSELAGATLVHRERSIAASREIVERAIARGELPPGADPEMVHQPLMSMLFGGVILKRSAPSESFLVRIIDALIVGASHDASVRAGRR